MPHHNFRPAAFLLPGGGTLSLYRASSWLRRFVKNVVHWSSLSGSQTGSFALLQSEALVVVLVDGGAPCRAQPPRAGQPEV
jgi:hypothetical protein